MNDTWSARAATHIRSNLIGYLALFVALSGTAYAVDGPLPGRNQVGSEDIIKGEVRLSDVGNNQITSAHVADDNRLLGGLFSEDIANGTLGGIDIDNNTLTSAEIKNGALGGVDIGNNTLTGAEINESAVHGLDDCPPGTRRYSRLCVEAGGGSKDMARAFEYCATLDLRLPTVGEGVTLSRNFDVPNVGRFWTDGFYFSDVADSFVGLAAYDDGDATGSIFPWPVAETNRTVCVTTPFN